MKTTSITSRIEQAILYLEKNFQHQPELDEVAEKVHLSPFHFQRIFTEWAGISPKRFLTIPYSRIFEGKIGTIKKSGGSCRTCWPLKSVESI